MEWAFLYQPVWSDERCICFTIFIVAASCIDNVKNGNETDKDCGGGVCPKCPDNRSCIDTIDCASEVCTRNICQRNISCL